ncbi:hypothetical protein KC844_19655, partial [Proteus mirabilis]|uniref:hypothetical protein n=1 Tax=Proteus mirabilis TaxID=584 RepID=UPI0033458D3F
LALKVFFFDIDTIYSSTIVILTLIFFEDAFLIELLIASHCCLVVLAGTPNSRVFDLISLGKISTPPFFSPEYLSI